MSKKVKSIIRKIIYLILFSLIIFAFIYLSDKYAERSERKVMTFNDYYQSIDKTKRDDVIRSNTLIKYLKGDDNKYIIFIGSHTSAWSTEYAKLVTEVFDELNIKNIKYYNLNSDKAQKNANYYELKDLLKGSLTSTDGSENNLLAPSLYIIEDGEVKYYNIDTVAMKNTITPEKYWTEEQIAEFKAEISAAIDKYYLNN